MRAGQTGEGEAQAWEEFQMGYSVRPCAKQKVGSVGVFALLTNYFLQIGVSFPRRLSTVADFAQPNIVLSTGQTCPRTSRIACTHARPRCPLHAPLGPFALRCHSQALLGLDKDARLPQDFDLVTPDMCSTPAESLASRDSRYTSTTSAAGLRPRTPKQDQPSRSPLVRESNTQPSRAASQTSPLFATPGPVAWAPVQRARKHAAGNDVWTSAELDRLKAETRTVRRPGTGIQGYSGGYVSQFEGPARGQPNPLPFRKMEGDCMAPAMPHAARPITEQTWELRRKAEESYKALGIADEIETWAENIKIWLVTQVLHPPPFSALFKQGLTEESSAMQVTPTQAKSGGLHPHRCPCQRPFFDL